MEYYCREAFKRCSAWEENNFFSLLNDATFRGRLLTDDEKLGFANLAFAGGRDTIINTVCLILAHFAHHPNDLERLEKEPELVNCAGEEFIRFATPLTHIGRKCPLDTEVHGVKVKADQLISLCWASANFRRYRVRQPRGQSGSTGSQIRSCLWQRRSHFWSASCSSDRTYFCSPNCLSWSPRLGSFPGNPKSKRRRITSG